MTHDLKDMVAIAAGSKIAVARWARLLRRAAIVYYTTTTTWKSDSSDPREAELWVACALADEARHVIRSAEVRGPALLW